MNTFYTIALFLHSWNRWIILISGLYVFAMALKGLANKNVYDNSQLLWWRIFLSSLHLQLLVGLLLYFVLSPITTLAISNFGAAMKDPVQRYWAVEHAFVNLIAIIVAQIGSIVTKRAVTNAAKNKRTLIFSGIALLLILALIPMGMMGVARPWFRF